MFAANSASVGIEGNIVGVSPEGVWSPLAVPCDTSSLCGWWVWLKSLPDEGVVSQFSLVGGGVLSVGVECALGGVAGVNGAGGGVAHGGGVNGPRGGVAHGGGVDGA